MDLHQDFRDLLGAFAAAKVRYVLVGGYAVAFHSRPRFTKHIDLWIDPNPENVGRAGAALTDFGAPADIVEALRSAREDEIVYMGAPPFRVDLFKSLPGVRFQECYARAVDGRWGDLAVWVIGVEDLVAAKRAAGRPQDLLDIETLEQAASKKA